AEGGDVVVGFERRRAEQVAQAGARGAAVRPVQTHAVAERPAEQLVHRHAERLGLDIPERQLDARDGLVAHAAEGLARVSEHVPVQALDRPRILADEQMREVANAAGDAVRAAVIAALSPAHQPVIRLDADEGPGPPAAISVQRLHARDLHGCPPSPDGSGLRATPTGLAGTDRARAGGRARPRSPSPASPGCCTPRSPGTTPRPRGRRAWSRAAGSPAGPPRTTASGAAPAPWCSRRSACAGCRTCGSRPPCPGSRPAGHPSAPGPGGRTPLPSS